MESQNREEHWLQSSFQLLQDTHTQSQPTTPCYLMGRNVNVITTWSKTYLEAYTFLTQTARNISFASTDTPFFSTVNTAELLTQN